MIAEILRVLAEIVLGMNTTSSMDEVAKYINKNKKVNKTVIAAAYSWIYEKLMREVQEEINNGHSRGIRLFSDEEILMLGMENYNYLLHFYNIGLLNNSDLDMILDKMKMFPAEHISTDSINLVVLSLFLDADNVALPGSRILLNSSDTIN